MLMWFRLFNRDGDLLSSAGGEGKVIAAIFANIWSLYDQESDLEFLMSEFDVCVDVKILNYSGWESCHYQSYSIDLSLHTWRYEYTVRDVEVKGIIII